MADFRRTSDELRNEFLNADKYVDAVASTTPSQPIASDAQAALPAGETPPVTEAAVATGVPAEPVEPDETVFDREAREARARLRDPERMEQAKAEGWKTPTDEAGTSDRWG
jgi:hypothetical protein